MEEPDDKQPVPGESEPAAALLSATPPSEVAKPEPAKAETPARDVGGGDGQRDATFWSRRKAPLVLFGLGVVFVVISYLAYPRPASLGLPGYSTIDVVSQAPIGIIDFSAHPASAGIVEVTVQIKLSELTVAPAGSRSATVYFAPPNAIPFTQCPHQVCSQEVREQPDAQSQLLNFPSRSGATATATFRTKANGIVPAANGLTASAALPQAFYNCPASDPQCPTPTLETRYDIASAVSYDWSSLPYQHVTGSTITWNEQVQGGATPGRVAVGIDSASQSRDDAWTFVAGALIGLAGGALLAGVQELLHPDK
jgi:hypothetical protein